MSDELFLLDEVRVLNCKDRPYEIIGLVVEETDDHITIDTPLEIRVSLTQQGVKIVMDHYMTLGAVGEYVKFFKHSIISVSNPARYVKQSYAAFVMRALYVEQHTRKAVEQLTNKIAAYAADEEEHTVATHEGTSTLQ